ncbi:hypothetical protein JOC55_004002 [Paenibacillus sacheonensis]|nr:hypothetical protein [Paenibacillus sacheonensis]
MIRRLRHGFERRSGRHAKHHAHDAEVRRDDERVDQSAINRQQRLPR